MARKGAERSREVVSKKLKKQPSSTSNAETVEVDEKSDVPHVYATVSKSRKDAKHTPSSSESNSDSSSDSDSENETEGNDKGVISVELHAYQSVGLVAYHPTPLECVTLDDAAVIPQHCEGNHTYSLTDYTTGCSIYDEVEGGIKSPVTNYPQNSVA